MATTMDVQALLRFLTTSAKVPLAVAMGKMKPMREAGITKIDDLATRKPADLQPIFEDEKQAKQIINAAKRHTKKRDTPASATASPAKKRIKVAPGEVTSPADLEESLALPKPIRDESILMNTSVITNRAPLILAFAVVLLQYTMPSQPLSSRLSLAQAWVSQSSRDRAVNLGIESGKSAGEEGFGQGQPIVRIMNRDIRVMRRWGYDPTSRGDEDDTQGTAASTQTVTAEGEEQEPPLWGIDLEALKKSAIQPGAASVLPIHTPQSARAYLLKAFSSPPDAKTADKPAKTKKVSGASVMAQREENLGLLLGAIELLYDAWSVTLDATELDKRTWGWYAQVRPTVADGVDGWGGKNTVKLGDILKLRPGSPSNTMS